MHTSCRSRANRRRHPCVYPTTARPASRARSTNRRNDSRSARAGSPIDRSASHNEIVTLDLDSLDYKAVCGELLRASDGNVDTGEVREFWGGYDEDREWRVHVRPM